MTALHATKTFASRTKRVLMARINQVKSLGKQKVFCIGRTKTGTTSLTKAMAKLGYVIGDQHSAEMLIRDWGRRDFTGIAGYCRNGEFFQDVPFSLPYTFQAMDMCFPGSKFILTIRDAESWYKSMLDFHLLDKSVRKILQLAL